ncbi:ABC transporter ATP-binding protein [Bifidobacterium apri]|uniref:Sugar ABC transporter n=1 Tax=Bifidobacterium apri TaxID=1769423 RepID=A0A6A2WD97_9BIFI|nr:ABC transporter ATP-binding protein [Bifidobacterium apri]KAB8297477.1 sugar ABC transporter [Bifidobacterium apri]
MHTQGIDKQVSELTEPEVALSVEHVSKSFRLPTEQATGLKQAFINWTKGIKGYKEQKVLKDISFEVHKGDFFGIVGRNGSGKSTLLKLISGIYVPDEGNIRYQGKLVPFIELGVGFNPELTGRENVYLNGALLGFTSEEIDAMYDDIVDFAELGEFMDQKLKNYSSGMQVRLAFSVAIKAQGDILVLDEVLAVGDEAFQRKCDTFFANIKKDPTKTVILVTHDMSAVKKYCNKAILIKDGNIIVSGDKDEVADKYSLENMQVKSNSQNVENRSKDDKDSREYPVGLNARVPVLRIHPVSNQIVTSDDNFEFDLEYEFNEDIPFYVAFSFADTKRGGISYDSGSLRLTRKGHHTVRYSLPMKLFNSTDFKVVASLREDDSDNQYKTKMIAFTNEQNSCLFSVKNDYRLSNYALLRKDSIPIKQEYVD